MTNALLMSASLTRDIVYYVAAALLVCLVLLGISRMSKVKTAASGNAMGSLSMLIMIFLTLWYFDILSVVELWIAMLIGSVIGVFLMRTVKMIQMPQMVGLLNGFGGAASMLAGALTLFKPGDAPVFSLITAGLAVSVGSLTFAGSVVAAGKLHGLIPGRSLRVKGHTVLVAVSLVLTLVLIILPVVLGVTLPLIYLFVIFQAVASGAFGLLFSIRVGGADMPVTISLLNSFSGVAGSIAGMAVSDPLLVAVGGVVGASGLLLTRIMCKAMNRSLLDILLGFSVAPAKQKPVEAKASQVNKKAVAPVRTSKDAAKAEKTDLNPLNHAVETLQAAKRIMLIPGYGMALAQAQHLVNQLRQTFVSEGKTVSFGIHPVAGRMPGHMNVLLAEADVPYDVMEDLDQANETLTQTDVVIVIGANDVVNPSAQTAEGTPIYGMPILDIARAGHVVFFNYDAKPGYAGVDNPLYDAPKDKVSLLFGDAAETLDQLLQAIKKPVDQQAIGEDPYIPPADMLNKAKTVAIIPGYGMALAQAQHLVKRLYETLQKQGTRVLFGIHPVAGRMPGHMNVLLAEADVPYDLMLDMEEVNARMAEVDVAVVIGANDVVNPSAQTAEGTPIYGMPILDIARAGHVVFFNYDAKPGYAGVDNPLYDAPKDKVSLLFGDAAETLDQLLQAIKKPADQQAIAEDPYIPSADKLNKAKTVAIIPGYGMALAQAQHLVKRLYETLQKQGTRVLFGIHPVAGRMPGHMNVLLAEADVPYDLMLDMEEVNARMAEVDVAVVIGANDVVNPSAQTAEGTPIYGMPILDIARAGHVVFFNYDAKPGYAGVDNPLYDAPKDKVSLLFGDAAETLAKVLDALTTAD